MRIRYVFIKIKMATECGLDDDATEEDTAALDALTDDDEENLIKKPHTTSVVWNYFGVKANEHGIPIEDEIEEPICRVCKKVVPAKQSNTSNLFRHLQDHHPEIYSDINVPCKSKSSTSSTMRQLSIVESVSMSTPYAPSSKKAKRLNRAVAIYLAKDMQPFYTVETNLRGMNLKKPCCMNLIQDTSCLQGDILSM